MLAMNLEKHMERLDEISGIASKEYSLEKALEKMLTDWQPLEFVLMEYRDTGTMIVGGIEEIQALLDDHIVKSQTMQGSPAIKPFEERAKAWSTKLVLIQDLIDIWLKVQGVWQYLEPIFGSEDIMRQMPEEGKLFKKQDAMWRGACPPHGTPPPHPMGPQALQEAGRHVARCGTRHATHELRMC
jgi:dynein heavy chain